MDDSNGEVTERASSARHLKSPQLLPALAGINITPAGINITPAETNQKLGWPSRIQLGSNNTRSS